MKRCVKKFCLALACALPIAMTLSASEPEGEVRPNILFIVVDDMNDWVGCLGGYPGTVHTPHLDQLAAQGALFTNAHCPSPKCAPSRAAMLCGLYPSSTGLYDNAHWWRPHRPDLVSIPAHFKAHGYRTVGAGKVHHHTAGFNPPDQWDQFEPLLFRNDPWFRGDRRNYPWSESAPDPPGFPFSGVSGLGHENDWGALPIADEEHDDARTVDMAVAMLQAAHEQPFFLACGLFRPHLPWYVPQRFFDLYSLDEIIVPEVPGDDLHDLPGPARKLAADRRDDFERIREADKWQHAVRAYLASISFADDQVGRLLDALRQSPHAANTIVVLCSDHGWHLGEKQHWHKSTLWERATRVPLIMAGPGIRPGRCDRPVNLIDLYPTLVELADIPEPPQSLDGLSLAPLLADPDATREHPSVIEFRKGNAAVRSMHHRYIRYHDGSEELYDHRNDPQEWENLAARPGTARIKNELARWLPQSWADAAPGKGQYDFDPETYTWKPRSRDDLSVSPNAAPGDDTRPNVLFIAIDDLRPALGCFGDTLAVTPNLDQLAQRGIRLNRAYCQQAVCSPSRLSLLTGRRPDSIRVWDLNTHFRDTLPDLVTLPQHFKSHGYETQSIGKIYHGSGKPSKDPPSWTKPPLFDHERDSNTRYATAENRAGRGLKRSATESAEVPDETYVDGLVCEAAVAALHEAKQEGKPFFLAVGFRKPHLPFCAPRKYWDMYRRDQIPPPSSTEHPKGAPELAVRTWNELEGYLDIPDDGDLTYEKVQELRHGYYACVSYIDALTGRLLQCLEDLELDDKTIVCVWGDHGFHLGEQGLWTKGNNFELSTRVPLIFFIPGNPHPGTSTDALVELIDVYPTLAQLCGLPSPPQVEGTSIVPLLEAPNRQWKSAAFSQYPRSFEGSRHRGSGDVMGYSLRTADHRYVEWREVRSGQVLARELYDHRVDPQEMSNIADDSQHAVTVVALREQLQAWRASTPDAVASPPSDLRRTGP